MKFYIRSKNYQLVMPHIQAYRKLKRTVVQTYGISIADEMMMLNLLTSVYVEGLAYAR